MEIAGSGGRILLIEMVTRKRFTPKGGAATVARRKALGGKCRSAGDFMDEGA